MNQAKFISLSGLATMMMDSLEEHQVGKLGFYATSMAGVLLKVVAPRLNESDSSCKMS